MCKVFTWTPAYAGVTKRGTREGQKWNARGKPAPTPSCPRRRASKYPTGFAYRLDSRLRGSDEEGGAGVTKKEGSGGMPPHHVMPAQAGIQNHTSFAAYAWTPA
jgi:hypothetical protein